MGKHHKAVTSRSHLIHLAADQIIGIPASCRLNRHLIRAELIPEPSERHAACGKCMDHICIGKGKVMEGHLPVGIKHRLGYRCADRKSCADGLGEHAFLYVSCANGSRRLVQGSHTYGDRAVKTKLPCHFRDHIIHHSAGLRHLGQLGFTDTDKVQHIFPITFVNDIPIYGGTHQGSFRVKMSGHTVDQIILHQKEPVRIGKYLRLILFQPQDLRGRPAWFKAYLPGYPVTCLIAKPLFHLPGFVHCPVIHPYNCIAQRLSLFVNADQRLSLCGYCQCYLVTASHRIGCRNLLQPFF